jgi:uncharacterized membrane protein YeaQ/YmgE (transglycosylase-associated protein family)
MTIETFLVWIAVGAIAGFLASAVVGGGYGILGDIVIGVAGAFIGGWLLRALGTRAPWGGLAGSVFTAFIGAIPLLVALRVVARARR